MKTAILLAGAGSASASAQAVFEQVGRRVEARFSGVPVRWAFAEEAARGRWGAQGAAVDAPAEALARLRREGFERVVVQSLHVTAGAGYRRLRTVVQSCRAGPDRFEVLLEGAPLLASAADVRRVVAAVLADLPPARGPRDAVILVAHGSRDPAASRTHAAVARTFRKADARVRLGRVVGRPDCADVVAWCRTEGVRRVFLLPFTVAAGSTVETVLAPEGDDSWAAALRAAGIACSAVPRGLAEYDGVVDIWLDHLDAANRGGYKVQ